MPSSCPATANILVQPTYTGELFEKLILILSIAKKKKKKKKNQKAEKNTIDKTTEIRNIYLFVAVNQILKYPVISNFAFLNV